MDSRLRGNDKLLNIAITIYSVLFLEIRQINGFNLGIE